MKTRLLIAAAVLVVGIRQLHAATITVTTTNDSGPGSLRDALASANDGDTINCSVTGTITLTGGELFVTNSVDIIGPGPGLLAVNGNAANRVFNVGTFTSASISSLTITNGSVPGSDGGGILNASTLTVSNVVLTANSASALCQDCGNKNGGAGIFNGGTLTVIDSTLSDNSAGFGGALFNYGAGIVAADGSFTGTYSLTIINSTLSNNSAIYGGGIYNYCFDGGQAILEVINCTLNGNSTTNSGDGGGIANIACCFGVGSVQIVNSTLIGNSADAVGGGVYNNDYFAFATVQIVNSTMTRNSAGAGGGSMYNIDDNPGGYGVASMEIGSTILQGGDLGANTPPGSGFIASLGYNLSSDDGGGFLTALGDQTNADAMLGPLQDNGGSTFTCGLLCGSPAIDQGTNFSGAATDQRGVPFFRTVNDPAVTNTTGGDGTDIGAFEVQHGDCDSPTKQIGDLIVLVQDFGLPHGTANSLIVKLQAAARALGSGNSQAGCGNLGAFLNEMNAQTGKKLTTAQAELLIAKATRIRVLLGCP